MYPLPSLLKRDASLKAGAAGDASQAAFRTCRGRRLTTRRKYKDASPSFLFDVSAASRDLLWDSEISGSRERLLLPQKTAGKLRLHFRPTWGWGGSRCRWSQGCYSPFSCPVSSSGAVACWSAWGLGPVVDDDDESMMTCAMRLCLSALCSLAQGGESTVLWPPRFHSDSSARPQVFRAAYSTVLGTVGLPRLQQPMQKDYLRSCLMQCSTVLDWNTSHATDHCGIVICPPAIYISNEKNHV